MLFHVENLWQNAANGGKELDHLGVVFDSGPTDSTIILCCRIDTGKSCQELDHLEVPPGSITDGLIILCCRINAWNTRQKLDHLEMTIFSCPTDD